MGRGGGGVVVERRGLGKRGAFDYFSIPTFWHLDQYWTSTLIIFEECK